MEGDLVEIEIYNKRGFRGKRKGTVIRVLERIKEILARLKRTRQETLAIPISTPDCHFSGLQKKMTYPKLNPERLSKWKY